MRIKNVKDLREYLKNLPDDMQVVLEARDHEYNPWVTTDVCQALSKKKNGSPITAWPSPQPPTEKEIAIWGELTTVLLISGS